MRIEADAVRGVIKRNSSTLAGTAAKGRRLSQLVDIFGDEAACRRALEDGDPLVYSVSSVSRPEESGELSYGLGCLYPGMVGGEYFMTRGHAHEKREATEVYVGLAGEGLILLQRGGEFEAVPFAADDIVFVPGNTAHRTVNVGDVPLLYLGVYPSDAGHDYSVVEAEPFRKRVLAGHDGFELVERETVTPGE